MWDIAFEGFYYQPMNEDLDFLTDENGSVWTNHVLEPDFDFGFRLEGSYHFKTGNDITVNWTRFRDTSSDTVGWSDNDITHTTTGNVRFEFDSVNVEFGQHVDVGNDVDLRFHTGIQFIHLDHILDHTDMYSHGAYFVNASYTQSDLRGIGVRGGIDWNYFLGEGFSFVSHIASSLIISNLEAGWLGVQYENGVPKAVSPYKIYKEIRRTIIPTGEAKIGLSYSHDFDVNGMSGTLMLEGGWQVAGYFHSILHVTHNGQDDGMFGEGNDIFPHHTKLSNFSMHGPYLMLKLFSSV